MSEAAANDMAALETLRRFLTEQRPALNGRLPVERELAEQLGVTRARLRKALAVLEAEGQIWRHVGRGTFFGPRPVRNLSDFEFLTAQTSPNEVMEARMAVEPQLARLASLHGAASDFAEIARCGRRCKAASDWRVYEAWDINFHKAIASATQNKLLVSLFDTMNQVRRATVWGQSRKTEAPPREHESFAEHDSILDAITSRDPDRAAESMRQHLRTIHERFISAMNL